MDELNFSLGQKLLHIFCMIYNFAIAIKTIHFVICEVRNDNSNLGIPIISKLWLIRNRWQKRWERLNYILISGFLEGYNYLTTLHGTMLEVDGHMKMRSFMKFLMVIEVMLHSVDKMDKITMTKSLEEVKMNPTSPKILMILLPTFAKKMSNLKKKG